MSVYCLECSQLKQDCCRENHSKFTTLGDARRLADFLGVDVSSWVIYAGLNSKDFEEDILINKHHSYYYDLTLEDGKLLQLKNKPDGSCCFQNEDGRCDIYPARPLICRTFPFWYLDEGEVIFDGCSADCRIVCAITGNDDPEDVSKLKDDNGSNVNQAVKYVGHTHDSIKEILDQMKTEIEDYRLHIHDFVKENKISIL